MFSFLLITAELQAHYWQEHAESMGGEPLSQYIAFNWEILSNLVYPMAEQEAFEADQKRLKGFGYYV